MRNYNYKKQKSSGFLSVPVLLTVLAILFANNLFAQISGTIAIPSVNYPTIKVAVDSLNLYGVAGGGGVTFNVAAGYTETLTARLDMTATGSLADPIVFQKGGAGANPAITSYTGTNLATAATMDGMWALAGSDYVTIDGINLVDAAANTTATTTMEYGYGLFKANGTDGANNNIIKNCVITLNRVNNTGPTSGPAFQGSNGIALLACTPATMQTNLTVTAASGASSNNKFYSNTIQNVNCGICLSGFAGASPFTNCDQNNDIGGSSALTGNNIINFGGGAAAANACAAVFIKDQWSFNVSYNTVNNNNGSGVNHVQTNRGIFANASSIGASATINNNNITIQGGTSTTAIDWAIDCEMAQSGNAAGNTISINNNTISMTKATATAVALSAIWVQSAPATMNINGNTITNFTCSSTSTSTTDVGVIRSGLAGIGTLNINNNIIGGVSLTGTSGTIFCIGNSGSVTGAVNITGNNINGINFTVANSKILNVITNTAAANTSTVTISNNNIQGITYTGAGTGISAYITGTGTPLNQTISGNTFTNLNVNTAGNVTFIGHSYTIPALGTQIISNNSIVGTFNKGGAGGTVTCTTSGGSSPNGATASTINNNFSNITVTGATTLQGTISNDGSGSSPAKTFSGNTYSNWTGGTGAITCVNYNYVGATTSSVSNNTFTNITGQGAITVINIGSSFAGANPLNISSNTINNITSTGTGGAVLGITCTNLSAIVNINSNAINTLSSTGATVVTGISIGGANNTSVFKNKIYDLSGSNASSIVTGILVSSGTLVNVHNNIVGDLRAPIANAANPLNGINITGGTTITASYNTVRLAASSTGALFGSSALSVSTTPTFTMRNNILINTSSSTGTGMVAAYRRSSTAISTYNSASNNNLLYAGTPSANNLIFFDGTSGDQTVMAFKTRVFPADVNSGTENPTFLSTVGSNANFLHIDPSVATNVESGAVNISGITDDYDLQVRQGNGGYVGTGTAPDIGADEFGGTPAVALAAPINFTFNTATTSSFNITWDDNSVGEAGFVVYRSTNPGGPFNIIIAAVVSTTSGTTGTTYTLLQTGLFGNTTYYYQIVANNFNSSAALPGSATTLNCGAGLAGTYTIPGVPYGSISAAIADLQTNGLSAPVILELDPTYAGAGETYPLTFGSAIGCLSSSNTLMLRPAATVSSPLTITSASTTATIDINGGNFVTIDGRPGGSGTNKHLIVENTSTTSSSAGNAILMRNEASNNTVTYAEVRSANGNIPTNTAVTTAGAIPGAIAIGNTAGLFGNDNNTISFCDIHSLSSGGNLGACIYSSNATTAGALSNNDNNVIDNNNIYDFFLASVPSAGIDVSLGNNSWTITNNHIYQTGLRNYTTGLPSVRGIWVTPNTGTLTPASGFTISGNYIGGNASNGTGAYTMTGTANYLFRGMDISVGFGVATSIQNNTITNLNVTGGFTGNSVYGIDVNAGNVNVGTTIGNLIGSTTTNGSITITTTVTGGSFIGLRSGSSSGGTINFSNNTISGIEMVGNATTIATGFNGIAASGGANITVNNNTVGSATLANSINMVSTSSTSTNAFAVRGIINNSGATGVINTITNNLVANINTNNNATGAQASTLIGIIATSGSSTISGNTVRNLTSASQTTGSGANPVILGVGYTSTATSTLISNNIIHTLKLTNTTATAATLVTGIYFSGPSTGTHTIERNFIHSLSLASPANSAGFISGMDLGVISGVTVTVKNNMIRLGYDETGASIISPCTIRGITKNVPNSNIWFNSIYIGGTGVGTTATNTFCLARSANATDDWRNNVLVNNRSNATTGGKHYSINLNATTTLTLDYNDYYGNGTGYIFGATGVTDFASYATNWVTGDAHSYNLDPLFINPTGTSTTVDLHIDPVNATIIEGTGTPVASVTNDFDNQTRASLTPVDMGADAGDFVNLLCNGTPPNSTASFIGSSTALCLSGTKTMTLSGFAAAPGITYQWQESLVQGGPYTDVTTGTGGATITYTTPTLTQTTYYVCIVTCSNGGAFTPSSELTVVVNNPQILSAPSVSRCGTGIVTLCAASSAGSTISWYNVPTGGSPLTNPYFNIPVTGFNNDIVAGGVGTNSILGTTYSFGPDGAGYSFMDNTFKYVSTNALPTCFMPVNKLAPSLLTSGLTYEFQDYGVGAALNNNALSIANQSTTYTSPLPSSGTLTLATPASYANLKVLYESVVNLSPLTVDATVTFTDATTQTFAGNTCVNWFTVTSPAYSGMGRTTPAGVIQCGTTPNMFELSLPISAANQLKQVQSITFSIPTVLSSGTTPTNVNYFHAMAVGGNAPSAVGCFTTPVISATTPYYVQAAIGTCISARTMVNATVTSPPAFAVTASQTVCNNAITMLNVTSPSANYDSITWAPVTKLFTDAAATIPYTGGNEDTVYFRSATQSANTITCNANNTLTPFCGNLSNTTVSVLPSVAIALATPATICISGSATLALSPASPYGAGSIQWQTSSDNINFFDIPGANSSSYTTPVITSTTYYKVQLKDNNGNICTETSLPLVVNNPSITSTSPASLCNPGSMTLGATASAGATINWYSQPTGGTTLGTGPSFVTPSLTSSATYYASATIGSANQSYSVGYTTSVNYSFITQTVGWGSMFTANANCILDSVAVFPTGTGTINIKVLDVNNNILYTGPTTNITGTGTQKVFVPVGAVLTAGNYKLGMSSTGVTNLGNEPTGNTFAYPFVSVPLTITSGSQGSGAVAAVYYWFYDWRVSIIAGCESPRVPVLAAISKVPTSIVTTTSPAVTCTPGQSVTLSVASSNGELVAGGVWEYQWMDETGTTVLQAWSTSSNFSVTAVSGLNKYRIYMRNSVCPGSEGFDYASFVVGITGSVIGVSPTGCSPTGTIIVSAQGSGVLTNWYNNDFTSSALGTVAAVTGSAAISGGQCVITPNTASQSGAFQVFNPGSISAANYTIDFDLGVLPSGADGFSYSFGDDVSPTSTAPNFECGTGTKFKLTFDAYPNAGGNVPGIYLMYNCNVDLQPPVTPGVLAYVNNTSWQNATTHVNIVIDPSGFVTVKLNGVPVINNVQLPASYLTANRSAWTHVFKARTGSISEAHTIDNLAIKYNAFEYSVNGPGGPWQSSNTFTGLAVGAYNVWVRNPADITCTADLGIFNLTYPTLVTTNATDTALCLSGAVTLSMSPLLAAATYQWDSSSVSASGPWFPIAGGTSATYLANISSTSYYRCNISCGGTPIPGSPSLVRQVLVNSPQVLNTAPASRCGIGPVTLGATGSPSTTLNWYGAATGGAILTSGSSYTTPNIGSTTTYYVEAATLGGSNQISSNGVPTTFTGTQNGGLQFTLNVNVTLNSIQVYSSAAGTATVTLENSANTVLYTSPAFPIVAAGLLTPQTLNLGWSIPAGVGYRIKVSNTGNSLGYATGVFPAPMGNGVGTITSGWQGSTTTTLNYFVYNMNTTVGCVSARTPVVATVNPAPAVTVSPSTSICEGDNITLTASSVNDPNYDYTWNPGGFTGGSFVVSPSSTTTYTLTALDNSGGVNNSCQEIKTVTVTVTQRPVINSLTSSPTALCQGDSAQISLSTTPFIAPTFNGSFALANLTGQTYTTLSGPGITVINTAAQLTSGMGSSTQDDGGVVITLPFTFNYNGNSFTQMSMSTNGWVGCGNHGTIDALSSRSPGNFFTSTIPNNTLAAWFKDMGGNFPTGTGSLRHGLIGTNVYAFQWNNAVGSGFSDGTTNTISFQVNIYGPGSVSPGRIEYIYGPQTNTLATGAAIGIEDAIGGTNHYINALTGTSNSTTTSSAWPGNGNGYRFTPMPPSSLSYSWSPSAGLSSSSVQNPKAAPNSNTLYTVTVNESGTGCSRTATLLMNTSPQPHPYMQEGDSILCSNDAGFYLHVLDNSAYTGGYPAGTQFDFYGAGAILYQSSTDNSFFNANNSDAFYAVVTLPGYLGGCTATSDTSVMDFGNTQAPQYALSTDSVRCYGESNGKAIAEIIFGGTPRFRWQWYNSSNVLLRDITTASLSDTLSGMPEGMYTFVLTDHQDSLTSPYCSITDSIFIGQPTAPLDVAENTGNHVDVLCNGAQTGVIDIDVTGGTEPYSYDWSNSATTEDLSNTGAGTYTCTVTDSRGCTVVITRTITEPTALALNETVNQVQCNGGTGSITLNVTGGVTPYSYEWSNNTTTPGNTGLTSGTYTVTVTDGNGCTLSGTFIIDTEPTAVTANCSATPVSCFGGSNGTVGVTAGGGTPGYTYLWSNGSTSASQSSLPKGVYTVMVTDGHGCTASCSTSITQPTQLVVTTAAVNPTSGLPNSGTINVNATGGTPAYSYLWNNGSTVQNRTSLSAGTYTVTVTDANGCSSSRLVTLTYTCQLGYVNTVVTKPSCGKANGVATVTGTGGTGYTYAWQTTPVQTTATATGLSYYYNSYCLITDVTTGCSLMDTVVLPTSNGLLLTLTSPTYAGGKNIRCNGETNGTISLTVSGSTGPYTYLWNTGATTQNLTGAGAGTYVVTVSNGGCTNSNLITLTQPSALLVTTAGVNVSCSGGSNGSATATPAGGTAPYSYSWNTAPVKTSATATGLTAGTYIVTVSDANGCTKTAAVTITQPATGVSVSGVVTNVNCNGGTTGSIDITPSGGTPAYTYLWTGGATTQDRINALAAGTYTVTVTDSKGCSTQYSNAITQPTAITATATTTNVNCNGGSNGTGSVTASGGTPPYTYSWNTVPAKSGANVNGIKKGTYTVLITDSKGCVKAITVTITEPPAIVIAISKTNVTTAGGSNGTATANVSGGVSPYSYSWNTVPAKSTQTATGLIAGTYTVTVTDANGCTKTASVVITQPTARMADGTPSDGASNSVVFPNPSTGKFTVTFDETISTDVNLQVINMTGERVFMKDFDVSEQSNSFSIDLGTLPKGIYFIRYRTNEKDWIDKLVIR